MAFLKSIWKNGARHKKLSDKDVKELEEFALKNAKEIEAEQPDSPESDKDVVTFKVKYLGSTVVEKIMGENISPEAVKNIIKAAKASGKKLQRVNVAISLKGIAVTDNKGNDLFEVSVYRISNCSTDKAYRQVFSFVTTDSTDTTECHAFWCGKRKTAEMVALTVAHAFSTAYAEWRLHPIVCEKISEIQKADVQTENMKNTLNTMTKNLLGNMESKEETRPIVEEKLIDFDDDEPCNGGGFDFTRSPRDTSPMNQWVCFEDDFVGETTALPSHRWTNNNTVDLFA